MQKKLLKFQTASMLVEAMISVFVIGFGAIALTKLQGEVVKGSDTAHQRVEAVVFAQDKIEALRKMSDGTTYTNVATSADSISGKNASYTRSWASTAYTSPNYKKINVTIAWQSKTKENHTVMVSTIISENDTARSGKLMRALNTNSNIVKTIALPNGATNNGDGTSDYSPEQGVTLTYNNSSGAVTKINGAAVHNLDGAVTMGSGSDKPANGTTLINLTLTHTSTNSKAMHCSVSATADAATYNCFVETGWAGSFTLGNINNSVKICTNTTQPYTGIIAILINQDYLAIKSTQSCSGSYPTLHQTL